VSGGEIHTFTHHDDHNASWKIGTRNAGHHGKCCDDAIEASKDGRLDVLARLVHVILSLSQCLVRQLGQLFVALPVCTARDHGARLAFHVLG